jgi:hypothetical protein
MPIFGVLGAALGVLADVQGWLDGMGFVTNLLSSLTGLLFGVPFALLVLTRLSAAQADFAEQRGARRLVERATRDLDQTVYEIFERVGLAGQADLERRLEEWKQNHESAKNIISQALEFWRREASEQNCPPEELQGSTEAITLMDTALTAARAALPGLPESMDINEDREKLIERRVMIQARWEEIDREIRVLAIEAGLDWIPHETRTKISAILNGGDNSVHPLGITSNLRIYWPTNYSDLSRLRTTYRAVGEELESVLLLVKSTRLIRQAVGAE